MNKNQYEILYGIHPVVEALKAKRRKVFAIYTTKPTPKAWATVEKLVPPHIPIHHASRDQISRMANTTDHQGVVAQVSPFAFRKQFFEPAKQPLLILLDGIQDVRNLGAIIRSAYCANFDGIIVCEKQGAPLNAAVFKASAGLAEHMSIYLAPSAGAALNELKKTGYHLYLAMFDGQNAASCEYQMPGCLVIGSEGSGISAPLQRTGTHVTLSQRTTDISYNASVAAGILMFLMARHSKKLA